MSAAAAFLVCVAALHFATAAFLAMHHTRRPRDSELLPLACTCLTQAIAAAGNAIVANASSWQQAITGQQTQLIGAVLSMGAFSVMARRMTGAPLGHAPRIVQVWCVTTLVAIAGGYCFAHEPRAMRTYGFSWAPDFHEARITTTGVILTWIIFPVALWMIARVNQRPQFEASGAERIFAFLIGTAAFWNDTLVRFGSMQSFYVTEIVTLVLALNANRTLRRRFQATTEELLFRTAELELSNLELEQMQTQLVRRQQLAAVGEFSAVIAHEVRNPIAIIKNAVSTLRRSSDAHQPEMLSILDEEIARLQRLVADLSTYTRPLVPHLALTALEPLLQQIVMRVRTANEAFARVKVNVAVTPEATHVFGDAGLIEMALTNVLANAAQAITNAGTIEVVASGDSPAQGVAVSVIDNGAGMPPDVVSKAREPFFTTRSTGTGLGLAIVDRVMRAHNGTFDIDSSANGTRITLRFPPRRGSANTAST